MFLLKYRHSQRNLNSVKKKAMTWRKLKSALVKRLDEMETIFKIWWSLFRTKAAKHAMIKFYEMYRSSRGKREERGGGVTPRTIVQTSVASPGTTDTDKEVLLYHHHQCFSRRGRIRHSQCLSSGSGLVPPFGFHSRSGARTWVLSSQLTFSKLFLAFPVVFSPLVSRTKFL